MGQHKYAKCVQPVQSSQSGSQPNVTVTAQRTLPPQSRKRLPLRTRVPRALAALALLLAVGAVAAVLLLAADKTQRGTGTGAVAPKLSGVKPVSPERGAAHDYDPYGSDGEHPK